MISILTTALVTVSDGAHVRIVVLLDLKEDAEGGNGVVGWWRGHGLGEAGPVQRVEVNQVQLHRMSGLNVSTTVGLRHCALKGIFGSSINKALMEKYNNRISML